jgi:hypothetical protein
MSESLIFGLLVLYKIVCLIVGWGFAFMGYRLFLADKTNPAGDLNAKSGKYAFSLRGGAPGIFFSLFGTVLICFSIFKGVEYRGPQQPNSAAEPLRTLPDRPPFAEGKDTK